MGIGYLSRSRYAPCGLTFFILSPPFAGAQLFGGFTCFGFFLGAGLVGRGLLKILTEFLSASLFRPAAPGDEAAGHE
jgi:hypothetical protein